MGGEADGGSVKYEPQKSHHPYILCHFERDVLGSVSGGGGTNSVVVQVLLNSVTTPQGHEQTKVASSLGVRL